MRSAEHRPGAHADGLGRLARPWQCEGQTNGDGNGDGNVVSGRWPGMISGGE